MNRPYGPWATLISAGQNPQLSAFWRRWMKMLVPLSQASHAVSRCNVAVLFVVAVFVLLLPTLRPAPADARQQAADEAKPDGKVKKPRSSETAEGPREAAVVKTSEVLEKLKKHDLAFESGFSVSGTVEEQYPFNADTGARRREERRWKFTLDGDRWGWKREMIHPERQKYAQVGSETAVRTRDWGYGGNDASGEYYQDTHFHVTPKNEVTEKGKGPMVVLYRPRDRQGAVGVHLYMWALGRMFSKELDKVTRVEKSKDGLLIVSARGRNAVWQNNGRWELEIEPDAAWMVRKARYYAQDYVDDKRECLYTEMTNSGTVWSGSYCIPKESTINLFAVVTKENARRLTFDPVVGKFDEKLYSDVQQAVSNNKESNLILDDHRVSPHTFTEPNRFKPENAQPGEHPPGNK